MKQLKKILISLVIFLGLGIGFLLLLENYIQKETAPLLYHKLKDVKPTQTAIILGASVHANGQLSPLLQDRVDAALMLFKNKKVKQFLVSGDHRTENYNEVDAISNYLLENGVPKQSILLDHAGYDTYDSMYRSQAVFHLKKAIIVTQKFHLPRALFIAKHLGLAYTGFAASKNNLENTALTRREKLANFKAFMEVIFKQKPESIAKNLHFK